MPALHCLQRHVRTDTEVAQPVLWTVPFSIGRFWSAADRPEAPEPCLDYAVNVLTSGAYRQRTEGRSQLVDASRPILLNRGQVYQSRALLCEDTRGVYLRIHPGMIPRILEAAGCDPRTLPRLPDAGPALEDGLLRRWYTLWRDACAGMTADELYERALALCLCLLEGDRPPAVASRPIRRRVEAVRLHLCADPASDETLDALAGAVGWSRFQLSRWFRAETGTTVHRYRERLRMARAAQALTGGPVDLTELALALGYTSHSHFTARFRRCFGVTPSRFRAQI